MTYKQVQDADMSTGYTGGWCLKFVQDAYHADHIFPTAIDAWNANEGNGNHAGEVPPLGITVPVYFSLGNVPEGHVAIRLDDGWVASSTQPGSHPSPYLHKSLDDLIAVYGEYNGGCTYLGWSEYAGSMHVVEQAPDAPANATDAEIQQAYQDILERPADADGLAHYRNFTVDFVRGDLLASNEYVDLQARKAALAAQPAPTPVVTPIHNPDVVPAPPVVVPTPDPVVPPMVQEPAPVPETPVTDTPATPPIVDTPTPADVPAVADQVQASWIVKLINAVLKALSAFWNYNLRG